jgi:hypothetical protein
MTSENTPGDGHFKGAINIDWHGRFTVSCECPNKRYRVCENCSEAFLVRFKRVMLVMEGK